MIRLGLPSKGRLKKQVEKFFSERGLELVNAGMTREYLAEFKGEKKVQIILLAASDIPLEIKKGNLDLGITGRDLIFDKILDWRKCILELKQLDFGEADLVIGVPQFWIDVNHLDDLDEVALFFRKKYSRCLRIATNNKLSNPPADPRHRRHAAREARVLGHGVVPRRPRGQRARGPPAVRPFQGRQLRLVQLGQRRE